MNFEFVINNNSYNSFLALLTVLTGVPSRDRFKWEIGSLVRLGGMITILVLAGLTDRLLTLHHK